MDFEETLMKFGFHPASGRTPRGVQVLVAEPNPFLTYTVPGVRGRHGPVHVGVRGRRIPADQGDPVVFPGRDVAFAPKRYSWLARVPQHDTVARASPEARHVSESGEWLLLAALE